jgi:indolepyruvate ferredoxin oxidoreductase alpha subunit
VILDNQVIAMTGQQPSPSMGRNMKGEKTPPVLPENVARALGVGFVEVVNPLNVKEAEKAFEKAIRYEGTGPAVVVSRSPCALFTLREARERGEKIHKYKVLEDACSGCGVCIKNFGCPAIVWGDNKKALINPEECTGCSVCLQICPSQAIVMEESAH